MKDKKLAKTINKYLAGVALAPTGNPLFRVVWSDDQREKRFGRFDDYYGKIYLRTFTGLREVPKYPWIRGKWVMEKWTPVTAEVLRDIPLATGGTYEPLYVFEDGNQNPLPLNEEIVRHIIHVQFHPILEGDRASRLRTEHENKLKKDKENDLMIMEDASPYIAGKIHGGEAIIRP